MNTRRIIRIALILVILIAVIFGIVMLSTSSKDKISNQQISYAELLQMIDKNIIDTIEIQEGSTQVTATDNEISKVHFIAKFVG